MGAEETGGRWTETALVSGAAFAVWLMGVGVFFHGAWAVPQGVAATLGLSTAGTGFSARAFLLGLAIICLVSFLVGTAYLLLAAACDIRGAGHLTAGFGFAMVVYGLADFVFLPGWLSAGPYLSASPTWSWFLAHALHGLVLGALAGSGGRPRRLLTRLGLS